MHLLLVNVCFTKKLSFIFSPLMFSRLFRQSEDCSKMDFATVPLIALKTFVFFALRKEQVAADRVDGNGARKVFHRHALY